MEAAELLKSKGFALRAESGRLIVSPAEQLTESLRSMIRQHKTEIIAAINDEPFQHLAVACEGFNATPSECLDLMGDDQQDMAYFNVEQLRQWAKLVHDTKLKQSGIAPDDLTMPAYCKRCGPVWLPEGMPAHVQGCMWCHVSRDVELPRPQVWCEPCKHYNASDAGWIGSCAIDGQGTAMSQRSLYPKAKRLCGDFRKIDRHD